MRFSRQKVHFGDIYYVAEVAHVHVDTRKLRM